MARQERETEMITAFEAAKQLGIRSERLYENIKRGVVSVKKYGNSSMLYLDEARKELEENGFFIRSQAHSGQKKEK